jgi:protease IV
MTTTTTTRTSRARIVLAALAVYVVVLLAFVVALGSMRDRDGGFVGFGPQVAIVEVEGMILDVQELVRDLRRHRDNPLVRAVVVRINSPGGVVGPTQEVHQALLRVREAGKPVVASLGAVAASGGYYIAVAADHIFANPGTLTGSIGVIMQLANFGELMKKVGVNYVVVKAGEFKDIGNPSRPMSDEERRVLLRLLENVHGQFVEAVVTGRKLPEDEVRGFADGRIFSGMQAKSLRMVDQLGSLEDAVNLAATMAGLPVPPRVIPPRRRISVFDLLRTGLGIPGATSLTTALPVSRAPLYLMD